MVLSPLYYFLLFYHNSCFRFMFKLLKISIHHTLIVKHKMHVHVPRFTSDFRCPTSEASHQDELHSSAPRCHSRVGGVAHWCHRRHGRIQDVIVGTGWFTLLMAGLEPFHHIPRNHAFQRERKLTNTEILSNNTQYPFGNEWTGVKKNSCRWHLWLSSFCYSNKYLFIRPCFIYILPRTNKYQ